MKWLKRFIARLFNIQPEDLPVSRDVNQEVTLTPVLNADIKKEIERQFQSNLESILMPMVNRSIDEKLRASLDKESRQVLAPEKNLQDENKLLAIVAKDIVGEEFPILDEAQLTLESKPFEAVDQTELVESVTEFTAEEIETAASTTDSIDQIPFPQDEEILPLEEYKPESLSEEIAPMLKPIEGRTLRLGIDFGTTTTSISIKVDDELPVVLPIGLDGVTPYIPSVAYFMPGTEALDQRVVVGEDAEGFGDQAHIIRSVKRCLGCNGDSCSKNGQPKLRFPWCSGNGKINISESESIEPGKIAYFIVREAIRRAVVYVRETRQLDLTNANVVLQPLNLGCSAKFNLRQRDIIRQAAKELGFEKVMIENVVEEPILAGFTFSRFSEDPYGRVLIYDFGGGTFDVAILEVDKNEQGSRVTVLTTAGDNWLGGDDIDAEVTNHFLRQAAVELGLTTAEIESGLDTLERIRLNIISRKAKESLSEIETYRDSLLTTKFGPIEIELTRAQFEQLLVEHDLIGRSLIPVLQACQLAYAFEKAKQGILLDYQGILKYSLQDASKQIDKVILVGGVTKIPYVRQQLKKVFPGKVISESVIDPISAVAIGGAYPRESQHYSLTAPPYGFFIAGVDGDTGKNVKKPVFEPYEFIDFHEMWRQNARPAHMRRLDLTSELRSAQLCVKLAGNSEVRIHNELGMLRCGSWIFYILLDGDMFFQMIGDAPRELKPYPIIHPIQAAIKRAKEELCKPKEDQTTYQDWIKNMMSEN